LSPKWAATPEIISELRAQFEKVFKRSFGIQDSKKPRHRKKASLHHTSQSFSQVRFDDALVKCISTLSPKCRDEELEDLIYFILDLYQFHDVALPISEVDVTQIVVDHATRNHGSKKRTRVNDNEHVFLVLDKNVQSLPWESIPILRGRSVSRIPSVDFLIDRRRVEGLSLKQPNFAGATIDPRKGYFILDPSGDLRRTEERFKDWAAGMRKAGWNGVVGRPVSEQQFENALRQSDLVLYVELLCSTAVLADVLL